MKINPKSESQSDISWEDRGHISSLQTIDVYDIETRRIPSPILGPDGEPARHFSIGMNKIGFISFD